MNVSKTNCTFSAICFAILAFLTEQAMDTPNFVVFAAMTLLTFIVFVADVFSVWRSKQCA